MKQVCVTHNCRKLIDRLICALLQLISTPIFSAPSSLRLYQYTPTRSLLLCTPALSQQMYWPFQPSSLAQQFASFFRQRKAPLTRRISSIPKLRKTVFTQYQITAKMSPLLVTSSTTLASWSSCGGPLFPLSTMDSSVTSSYSNFTARWSVNKQLHHGKCITTQTQQKWQSTDIPISGSLRHYHS